jgi:gamma-glutamyltranspeptidase / glutathione hydrolase
MGRGVVAAGHPVSAEAGARVLRAGGNAVDAALACMCTSFVCEPMLTGFGAGGYMLVVPPGRTPVLLDFFVEAPGRAGRVPESELIPVEVSFGDVVQVFNVGAASVGTYGVPAGMARAAERFGTVPLAELVGPAAALARSGVAINSAQAYIVEILGDILRTTPEATASWLPAGRLLAEGERWVAHDVADALERFGAEGAAPFYEGDLAAAASDWVLERGGILGREDLAAYEVAEREPVSVAYRGREVLTNPPPSAGGILIAHALALLEGRVAGPPDVPALIDVMERVQAERTPEFLAGLAEPGFAESFAASRLGSTTHTSVLDTDGWACSVTCTNGEGSGLVVPGTGLHLNNILGEEDLNPLGFHRHPPGRRLPSMMAPTAVLGDGEVELVLGSAGSNRIRSAILQVLVGVVDRGLAAGPAVEAPRVHVEEGVIYAEPGIDVAPFETEGRTVERFRSLNVFFGGAQAVERDPRTGALSGGGDPRRGGAVVAA